jgi:hypothetical protein
MLALLVVVAPIVVWQYALGGTVRQWRATGKYHRQTEELRAAQPSTTRQPQVSTTDREMILSGELVGALLPTIEAERLRIEHFSPCVTSDIDGLRLATGQLTVQGRFAGIVRLLDEVERTLPHCKVISTHYRTTRPRNRNEAKTLSCTIYIQQITTND